ncbi:MAG: hypothetical protein J6D02_04975 [Lachnospira sp.]|nr:hypothetical protein [Lachnospira sp.]
MIFPSDNQQFRDWMSRKDAIEPWKANLHRLRQKVIALWEYHRKPYSRTTKQMKCAFLFHAVGICNQF